MVFNFNFNDVNSEAENASITPTEFRLRVRANGYQPIPVRGKVPALNGWTGLGSATTMIFAAGNICALATLEF